VCRLEPKYGPRQVGGTGATLTFSDAVEGNAQVIWWNKDGTSDITFGGDT
jgi:hypothetical protein